MVVTNLKAALGLIARLRSDCVNEVRFFAVLILRPSQLSITFNAVMVVETQRVSDIWIAELLRFEFLLFQSHMYFRVDPGQFVGEEERFTSAYLIEDWRRTISDLIGVLVTPGSVPGLDSRCTLSRVAAWKDLEAS